MGIDAKHFYRFGYLKSEQWKAVRLEALVRENGKCEICKEESIYNDAHHVWYPARSITETTQAHLAVLCRACHSFLHVMLPDCKTNDMSKGFAMWTSFKNAIIAWRLEKLPVFTTSDGIAAVSPKQLKEGIAKIRKTLQEMPAPGGNITMNKGRLVQMLTEIENMDIPPHLRQKND